MNNISISKNFKLREFQCKDGSNLVKIDSELLEKLQKMRDILKKPVIITSAYRTKNYNKKVGGASASQHLYGKAADIRVSDISISELKKVAEKVGFRGIGTYRNFLHVDTRRNKARWKG